MKFSNILKINTFSVIMGCAFSVSAQSTEMEKEKARLKADISFLASDQLGGRQTGSSGELASATYIKNEFKKNKLTLLGKDGFQEFSIIQLRIATEKCRFAVNSPNGFVNDFKLFEEYYPLSLSSNNDSITAETIDVGYGLVSEKEKRDDYTGLDVAGKVAVIRLGYLGSDEKPNSPLAEVADISTKVKEAEKRGVVGIIFIRAKMTDEDPSGQLSRTVGPTKLPIFYFKPKNNFLRGNVTMKSFLWSPTAVGHNVMAFKNNHRKKTVVICAHHDHIGNNEYDNSKIKGITGIHNGADDNASGVATLLELSRKLKGWKYRKNNYLFLAFSGEELGLIGSKFFIQNPEISLKTINYVINIDMLGRIDSAKQMLTINGVGTSPDWTTTLQKVKTDTTQLRITTTESGMGPSDHASFYLEGIPVLHFFSGQHKDYHTPDDDEFKINYQGMYNSIEVIKQVVKINNKCKKLPFTKTKDATPGRTKFKITMGVMPDYSYSGKGMKIDGVSDNKPAFKAGLMRNDIIVKLGENTVTGVEDYMVALSKFNAGDKTTATIIRGSETIIKEIQF